MTKVWKPNQVREGQEAGDFSREKRPLRVPSPYPCRDILSPIDDTRLLCMALEGRAGPHV